MAPLRLQIVVQPRTAPSASDPRPPEPSIKWLEICPGNPTIQELSEILESRFYQRNHVYDFRCPARSFANSLSDGSPLDIKILKFLDDLELYPSYRVRDIFEDLKDDKDGAKQFSTVKVYRNPPTAAHLSDPRRFESLPADSLARPRKRPLPPLFVDTVRDDDREELEHRNAAVHESPDRTSRPSKRHKARQSSAESFFDPDEPLDSLEGTLDRHDSLRRAHKQKSPRQQVEDSQRSLQRKRLDPYGTPISSQISPQEQARPGGVEVISIPDTPPHQGVRSREAQSPEIPSSVEHSSESQGVFIKPEPITQQPQKAPESAEVKGTDENQPSTVSKPREDNGPVLPLPMSIVEPPSDPQPQGSQNSLVKGTFLTTKPSLPSTTTPLPISDLPTTQAGFETQSLDNDSEVAALGLVKEAENIGQLQRPKTAVHPLKPKRARKVINGIRQKTPSVFDPVDTSDGSSSEREKQRSAKKVRHTSAPRQTPNRVPAPGSGGKKSPGGQFLFPKEPSSKAALPQASLVAKAAPAHRAISPSHIQRNALPDKVAEKATSNILTTKVNETSTLDVVDILRQSDAARSAQIAADSIPTTRRREKLSSGDKIDQYSDATSSQQTEEEYMRDPTNEGLTNGQGAARGNQSKTIGDESLDNQMQSREESKQKAQAEFDRIAARANQLKEQEKGTILGTIQASKEEVGTQNPSLPSHRSPNASSAELQPPTSTLNIEASRQYALQHQAAARDKMLRDLLASRGAEVKAEQQQAAAIKKQRRVEQLAEQRQVKNAARLKLKEEQAAAKKVSKVNQDVDQQEVSVEPTNLISDQHQPAKADELKAMRSDGTKRAPMGVQQPATAASRSEEYDVAEQRPNDEMARPAKAQDDITTRQDVTQTGQFQQQQQQHHPKANDVPQRDQNGPNQRSPKARLNAERQIQIANQTLKHTKRGSTVPNNHSLARPLSKSATEPKAGVKKAPMAAEQPASKNAPNKRRNQLAQLRKQHKAGFSGFTDSDALRAAGFDLGQRTTTPAGPTRPSAAPLAGILKNTGSESSSTKLNTQPNPTVAAKAPHRNVSSPSMRDEIDPIGRRTMTPPIPSLSMRSDPHSMEAKAARRARAVTANLTWAPKTPTQNVTGVTPRSSQRSVSFLESICSSQPEGDVPEAKVQAAKPGRGMFQRALDEFKAEAAEPPSPFTAVNKVNKTPARTTQTKMTQHISRDRKLKGKAVNPPSPIQTPTERQIIISSGSEASTFYSDESENERNARAGPSSRKKAKAFTNVVTPHQSVKIKQEPLSGGPSGRTADSKLGQFTAFNSQSLAHQNVPVRDRPFAGRVSQSPAPSGRRNNGNPLTSAQRLTTRPRKASSLRSSQTYSTSDAESRRSSTDDPALLPPENTVAQKSTTPGHTSTKERMTAKVVRSDANQKPSGSLKSIHPRKIAGSAFQEDDPPAEDEASRQLRREIRQALEAQSSSDVSSSRSDKQKGASPEKVPSSDGVDRQGRESYGTKVRRAISGTFEHSKLSQLRKEQAARQEHEADRAESVKEAALRPKTPEEVIDASESDDESSSSVSNDTQDLNQQVQAKTEHGAQSRLQKGLRGLLRRDGLSPFATKSTDPGHFFTGGPAVNSRSLRNANIYRTGDGESLSNTIVYGSDFYLSSIERYSQPLSHPVVYTVMFFRGSGVVSLQQHAPNINFSITIFVHWLLKPELIHVHCNADNRFEREHIVEHQRRNINFHVFYLVIINCFLKSELISDFVFCVFNDLKFANVSHKLSHIGDE
ncbi:MAG: hypothetical protein Q9222_005184 [Ikaeria aurantiellina]